ncbi:DUF1294 domain-containing protein [Aneurinibacillus thermoaerophilus]|nr:DUF1294 domain-containing protein [Aneurinibacillus thermoaerophilus]
MTWLIGYAVVINVAGFILMGADKRRARRGLWRIKEKTLFLAALLGGAVGCLAGMYTFRHKTKHWRFVAGIPTILLLEILLVWFLMNER